ncbi:hypothetical protein KF707C_1560 [Metapseudomonas furukawaii]|uniref:Uncharacterized protein n=1 Tax=Metapseudomonas furukawaii TaxID=1149133 RepID=A0AAD1BXV0_METFU|nr:hypothetical protein KF707C_1560 [Pseudomonas furukawaii]
MVGAYCAWVTGQTPHQGENRRDMCPGMSVHFGHSAGSFISRGSLIGFLGEP